MDNLRNMTFSTLLHRWILVTILVAAGTFLRAQTPLPVGVWGYGMQPLNMEEMRAMIGYPAIAQLAHAEGIVEIRVRVDPFGQYREHEVVKNPHPALTYAVERKARLLVFPRRTGPIDWKNPDIWVFVPFEFLLNQCSEPLKPVPEEARIHQVKAILEGSHELISYPDWAGDDRTCRTLSGCGPADVHIMLQALEAKKLPDFPGDELLIEVKVEISIQETAVDITVEGDYGSAFEQAIMEALAPLRWKPFRICFRPAQAASILKIRLQKVQP